MIEMLPTLIDVFVTPTVEFSSPAVGVVDAAHVEDEDDAAPATLAVVTLRPAAIMATAAVAATKRRPIPPVNDINSP